MTNFVKYTIMCICVAKAYGNRECVKTGKWGMRMGIFQEWMDLMSTGFRTSLGREADPQQELDVYLQELKQELAKVKADTAAAMAEENQRKRELDACEQEIENMQRYAEKALEAGNEEDARKFLTKKVALADQKEALEGAYAAAASYMTEMRMQHDRLTAEMRELENHRRRM